MDPNIIKLHISQESLNDGIEWRYDRCRPECCPVAIAAKKYFGDDLYICAGYGYIYIDSDEYHYINEEEVINNMKRLDIQEMVKPFTVLLRKV